MVFLTSLDILDTGFLAVDRDDNGVRTNQLGTADRVNAGVALRLKGVNFDINTSSNISKNPTPGKVTTNRTALVSVNPDMVTITLMLNQRTADDTAPYGVNDMSYLSALTQLPKTRGFKAVYYPVDETATPDDRDKGKQMVNILGTADSSQPQGDIDISLWTGATNASSKDLTDVKYMGIRFESCQITQTPDSKIMATLSGVVTD